MTTNAVKDGPAHGTDEEEEHREQPDVLTSFGTPLTIITYGLAILRLHGADAANTSSHDPACADSSPDQLKYRIMGGPESLTAVDLLFLGTFSVLALELMNFLVKSSGYWFHAQKVPVRGKHLDFLSTKDQVFIGMNKVATAPFVYFMARYIYYEPNSVWDPTKITLWNTLLPIPIIFIVYDFFYTLLHWALHVKAIYGYIHKHHHHQKAPSRANIDAINVHPIEYFLGEYNHIFSCFLYCRVMDMKLHVASIVLFLVIGAILAGLNHTRFDVVFKFWGITLYDSKHHDVHHRIPQSNYGQYVMFWDRVFGSFRDYDQNDRINAKAQLDPITGKSIEFMETQRKAGKLQ